MVVLVGTQYTSPYAFKLHEQEYADNKAGEILRNTERNLSEKRKPTAEEKSINEELIKDALRFVNESYVPIVAALGADGQLHPREMAGELADQSGVYKLEKPGKNKRKQDEDESKVRTKAGCTNVNSMAGRVGDQIERWIGDEERDGMSHEEIADRIKQLTKRYATVCATSEELQGIVDTTPELKTIIEKIARSRASCAVNEDHFDVVLGETRNFLFELLLASISRDEYGYAMEKYLHHGSVAVYNACKLPTREQNSGAIQNAQRCYIY